MRVKDLEEEGLIESVLWILSGVDAILDDGISPWATSELISDILYGGLEEVDAWGCGDAI